MAGQPPKRAWRAPHATPERMAKAKELREKRKELARLRVLKATLKNKELFSTLLKTFYKRTDALDTIKKLAQEATKELQDPKIVAELAEQKILRIKHKAIQLKKAVNADLETAAEGQRFFNDLKIAGLFTEKQADDFWGFQRLVQELKYTRLVAETVENWVDQLLE